MIINTPTVIITLIIIAAAFYVGLHAVRSFAYSIALENHDANVALDNEEESKRLRMEKQAEAAESAAFAKVEPLLPVTLNKSSSTVSNNGGEEIVESKKEKVDV